MAKFSLRSVIYNTTQHRADFQARAFKIYTMEDSREVHACASNHRNYSSTAHTSTSNPTALATVPLAHASHTSPNNTGSQSEPGSTKASTGSHAEHKLQRSENAWSGGPAVTAVRSSAHACAAKKQHSTTRNTACVVPAGRQPKPASNPNSACGRAGCST